MKLSTLLIILANIFAILVILIIDKLFFLDITKRGWRRAERELPNLAQKLGLEFSKGKFKYEIGKIHGQYQGRAVHIMPDNNASAQVEFFHRPKLEMSTYRTQRRYPPEGLFDFDSGNKSFNDFFQTRFANPEICEKLAQSAHQLNYLNQFKSKWKRILRFLTVNERGISCSVKYGQATYIPADILERLLPDLCQLANLLEAAIYNK